MDKTTAFFNFAASPVGQALLQAALQLGGTIVEDIASLVKAHAASVKTPAVNA